MTIRRGMLLEINPALNKPHQARRRLLIPRCLSLPLRHRVPLGAQAARLFPLIAGRKPAVGRPYYTPSSTNGNTYSRGPDSSMARIKRRCDRIFPYHEVPSLATGWIICGGSCRPLGGISLEPLRADKFAPPTDRNLERYPSTLRPANQQRPLSADWKLVCRCGRQKTPGPCVCRQTRRPRLKVYGFDVRRLPPGCILPLCQHGPAQHFAEQKPLCKIFLKGRHYP